MKLFIVLVVCHVTAAGWSDWQRASCCTEDCGYGIQFELRQCLSSAEDCQGPFYKIKTCYEGPCTPPIRTEEEIASRKADLVCHLYFGSDFTESPLYAYAKPLRVGSCNEICADNGEQCLRSFKIYPDPERRLENNLPQVFEYPNCNTIHSNVCCCVDQNYDDDEE